MIHIFPESKGQDIDRSYPHSSINFNHTALHKFYLNSEPVKKVQLWGPIPFFPNIKEHWTRHFVKKYEPWMNFWGKCKVMLNYASCYEIKQWSGDSAPCILNLRTRWRLVVSFIPWPLHLQGKSPQYPMNSNMGGPQTQSGNLQSFCLQSTKGKVVPVLN
jgi:hypothetical protein